MPAYLIVHPRGQKKDDVFIEGDDLALSFDAGWAILSDSRGPCLAVPSGQGASIQRVDESTAQEEPLGASGTLNK